jgi:hypothetical protein
LSSPRAARLCAGEIGTFILSSNNNVDVGTLTTLSMQKSSYSHTWNAIGESGLAGVEG